MACGFCCRLCPSNSRFHIFDPSGLLRQAWRGDTFRGAHELTLVVEGNKEFRWLTEQCGAVGAYTLTDKQGRSMPHALIYVAVLRIFTQSGWPTDSAAMSRGSGHPPTWRCLCQMNTFMFTTARTNVLRPSTRQHTITGHPLSRTFPGC
jgi:hypothetical protein